MPLDGSDVASKPAGTTAVPDTTIESAKFNSVIDDIYNIFNTVRTIAKGYTGASTAQGAVDNFFDGTTTVDDDNLLIADPAANTKRARLDVGGVTAGQTRVLTVPDGNMELAGIDIAQTFSANQTFSGTVTISSDFSSFVFSNNTPGFKIYKADGPVDAKDWAITSPSGAAGALRIVGYDGTGSGSPGTSYVELARAGNQLSQLKIGDSTTPWFNLTSTVGTFETTIIGKTTIAVKSANATSNAHFYMRNDAGTNRALMYWGYSAERLYFQLYDNVGSPDGMTLNWDGTTLRRGSSAEFLQTAGEDYTGITSSFSATADNDGTQSSGTYTPALTGGNLKRIVNGGAFTLAAPTDGGDYSMVVQITNNASAGAVTFSGFTQQTGDSLTTTNGDDFMLYITKVNGFTHCDVVALQ